MPWQYEVLKFIAARTRQRNGTSLVDLMAAFDLSPEGAAGHLSRVWRDRLVEAVEFRPPRFRFRLQAGESIAVLHFRLTPRGQARLVWLEKPEDSLWA